MFNSLNLKTVTEHITIRANGRIEKEYAFNFRNGNYGHMFKDGEIRLFCAIADVIELR